jgi:pimeloyl-ACP methyl ester carboxylesterase
MSLEPVNAIHRPLLVYLIVALMKIGAGFLLRLLGYRRIVATTGLVGWYKPGKRAATEQTSLPFLPLLFFHGIAPSGLVLYLPMILFGIATEPERPIFLFENRSISCTIDFAPLTEEETIQGIQEIVDQCLGSEQSFSVMGHSFGSCPIAWLVKSKLADRIQQIALLDPVAILLSEPDVMVNFLYARETNKIRMVASSELFTEFYLRRHFAWYNSELWLQDLQRHHRVLVCLSEQDKILSAKKVKQELERHASETAYINPVTVYWNNVGHGACISSPDKWKQIKGIMLEQELEIVRHRQR